jgi:hypothetical protein
MALLGRMVTAVAGRAVARTVGGAAAGPAGLVIGTALPMLARRLGPMGMIGVAVGAWAINRIMHERAAAAEPVATPVPDAKPDAAPDQIINSRSAVTS